MPAAEYRDSLRAYKPRVFVNGNAVESVADEPLLAPGINGVGVTYDFALLPEHVPIMTARQGTSGKIVNRMLHINETSQDLLYKLEAVRLVCRTVGCAQRYLAHDALNGLYQSTNLTDDRHGTDYSQRFLAYLHEIQDKDLTLGIAMTDAKGDRSKRPSKQVNPDAYVHIKERRPDGIIIRGTKAIVTGAPYMHEFLVMPCRTHNPEDRDFAVCCAVPCAAPGVTIIAAPPRPPCLGARAGFGDLLIGAGALMIEANGLDIERHAHIREAMVELITITESFYACGVASSVYCTKDPAGSVMPDAVFSNIGKLLLATKIYDMHRVAHYVSGGLIVALPGPEEDHNPETRASLAAVMGGRPDIPADKRAEVARFIEDLTVSHEAGWYSVISLRGGGSPEAMKREIWRNYPVMEKVELVEGLLDRGILDEGRKVSQQPGRCCATGCQVPEPSQRAELSALEDASE